MGNKVSRITKMKELGSLAKPFWQDNWYGNFRFFDTLKEAIASAKKERHGASIEIYNKNGVVRIVEINGSAAV